MANNSLMNKAHMYTARKQFFLKLGTSGLVAALLVGVVSVGTRVTVPQRATIAEIAAGGPVTLDASPPPTNLFLNRSYQLDINAHSGTTKMTAVQLDMSYDPSKLQINSVSQTSYFPIALAPIYIASGSANGTPSGQIGGTVGVAPNSGGLSDWGTVVSINVKPLAVGTQTIFFGQNTRVAGIGSNANMFGTANPIFINVFNPGDLNFDGHVDIYDYNALVANYGNPYTIFDYNDLVANYGKTLTSTDQCTARPACLDSVPRCLPVTPIGGWCAN